MTKTCPQRLIGLLGGMGWPATVSYYEQINRLAQNTFGGSHSARMVIWSNDYAEMERMQLEERWDDASDWLTDGAIRLEAAGAQLLGIACNTMHRLAPAVRRAIRIPLIDMIDETADAVVRTGLKAPVILGTRYTLRSTRYAGVLGERGVTPRIPNAAEQAEVDRVIYDELCRGVVSVTARDSMVAIAADAVRAGADGVLLACTELSLLESYGELATVPVLDSTRVHASALFKASFSEALSEGRPVGND